MLATSRSVKYLSETPEGASGESGECETCSFSRAFATRPSHSPFTTARFATNDPCP